jgi:hypothetical protein
VRIVDLSSSAETVCHPTGFPCSYITLLTLVLQISVLLEEPGAKTMFFIKLFLGMLYTGNNTKTNINISTETRADLGLQYTENNKCQLLANLLMSQI